MTPAIRTVLLTRPTLVPPIRTCYLPATRWVADVRSRSRCQPVGTMRKRPITIDLQPWPYPEGPRVLIEHSKPDAALELASAIRKAGCKVGMGRGPDATADPATRCPLHRLEPCVAVEGADLVVTVLGLEEEEGREVVRGLRTRYPNTPLVVAATVSETLALGHLLDGCTVVPVSAAPEEVVAAVLDSLPSNSRSRPTA
jgi:hypothetical protein